MNQDIKNKFKDKLYQSMLSDKLSAILQLRRGIIEDIVAQEFDIKIGKAVSGFKKKELTKRLEKCNELIIDIMALYSGADQDDLLTKF